jgi:NAD+ kinase
MSRTLRRIGIHGHTGRAAVRLAAGRLVKRLRRRGLEVRLDEPIAHELGADGTPLASIAAWCQVLVALGGDGTALRTARAMAGRRGLVVPVNFGGLGFLTVAEESDLDAAVDAALKGGWPVISRRMVGAVVRARSGVSRRAFALNEAVIRSVGGANAVHLRLSVLGSDLGHLVADGVICASAAGSTAYSLSAGGPLLAPDLEALVVTPVCPHTLGSRPLVLSPRDALTLRVLGGIDNVVLIVDGQQQIPLAVGDEVTLGLSRRTVRMLQNPTRSFAQSLQHKLGWQVSHRRSLG